MGPPVVDIPERFNAATFFVDRHVAEGRGGRVVFRFEGRSVTYGELAERVNRFGNALLDLGVEMENRVLLILPDSPELAIGFWGAIKIGASASVLMATIVLDAFMPAKC